MFFKAIAKPWSFLPYLTIQRYKVKHLPKEHYDDEFETPYMKARAPKKSFLTDYYAFMNRQNWTFADIMNWWKRKRIAAVINDQKYMPERHKHLGPDLAAAHFLAFRGGKVKFKGQNEWITDTQIKAGKIPGSYIPGFFIEEIDASNTSLCYEGFENLCNLRYLKKLILRNCEFVDDWCLNRTHFFERSLEHLDVSGCQNISERGICTLHNLKKLKNLVIHDTPHIQNKELLALMLQEVIPNCEVVGVDFNDPVLLKRVEKYTKG